MRELFFNRAMTRFPALFLLAAALASLAACSDNTGAAATSTTPVAGTIAIGTDKTSILTDNATTATLTATLVDSSNALMSGVDISFSTSSGNLNASSATTDANGQATVTLISGLSDFSNRTALVTASVTGGQAASIPILIQGSTLALTLSASSVEVGATTPVTATATATDAGGLGKSGQTIRFSIGAASTGTGTLSAATLTTNASGIATPLTFTPTAAGTVVLTAEWLDATGAVTATATQNIDVTATGTSFAITTPAVNPTALSTAASQAIAVTVPAMIGSTLVVSVRLSATSGSLTGSSPATGPLSSILQTPVSTAVAALYTAPANSGSVTVQVDALDASGTTLSSLTRTFVISATAASAADIILTASKSTVSPSAGSSISTLTLYATVRNASSSLVGGAPVMFGLVGTTGSGETVSPAVVYTNTTDELGIASTTFSAGTLPTVGTIYAQASIVGQVCTFVPNVTAETNPLCAATPLIVSSTAVSITIGFGTAIEDTADSTQYKLPGSVMVVDANGSGVAGATVTLTAFPARYRNGSIYAVRVLVGTTYETRCGGPYDTTPVTPPALPTGNITVFTDNEDVNRNAYLDDGTLAPAEDTTPAQAAMPPWSLALAILNNGLISPPHAAGGSVPMTVTTDSNGAATFDLQYLKSSAWFIEDEVTARVIVNGTESTAKINYLLPMSVSDAISSTCIIGRTATY
ncbi:MAG: Ig-like domain-containing protein [Gallionella sp.]|nr:Ig-like domain-containing protein [Gallionella sp.]